MLENDEGADFLPVRLATVVIVAALVLVSAVCYAGGLAGQLSRMTARDCAARIVAVAAVEYPESCQAQGEGTFVEASVPQCVARMTFGLPSSGGTASEPCAYSIQFADGSCELYLSGIPLGSGSPGPGHGEPLVLYPGSYDVHISTEEVNGRPMALLYAEAK